MDLFDYTATGSLMGQLNGHVIQPSNSRAYDVLERLSTIALYGMLLVTIACEQLSKLRTC